VRRELEKRRHTRVGAHFPIKFCETSSSSRVCRGALAKDVSLGGLRFHSEFFLPRDTRLFLEFSLPDEKESVKTFARVAWMRSLPAGYRFEIGTEFTDLSPKEQVLLESLTHTEKLRPARSRTGKAHTGNRAQPLVR
jgi:hypothetical protein